MRIQFITAVVAASLLCFVVAAAPPPKPIATTAMPPPATQTAAVTDTAATERLARIAADIESTKRQLTGIREDVGKIADNTKKSFFKDITANYVMNLFWEFFGFHKTQKSAVGLGVSALGILLSLIRVSFFFYKRRAAPPAWLRGMMVGYWCLLVATLTAVTITGFFGDHTQVQQSVAKADVHTIESRLDKLTKEVHALRNQGAVWSKGAAPPAAVFSDIAQVRMDTAKLRAKWTGWSVGIINLVLIVIVGVIVMIRTEPINRQTN